MRGRLTILLLIAAAASGFGLYRISYATQGLESELRRLNRHLIANDETLRVLRAEWSQLNRPERIADLARRHLGTAPIGVNRIVALDDLPFAPPPAETDAPVVAHIFKPRPKPSFPAPRNAPELAAEESVSPRSLAEIAAALLAPGAAANETPR